MKRKEVVLIWFLSSVSFVFGSSLFLNSLGADFIKTDVEMSLFGSILMFAIGIFLILNLYYSKGGGDGSG